MSFFAKVIRNTTYLVASQVVTRLFYLALAMVIARKLGPAGLGKYGFAMAFVMVIVPISELGLTNLAIRKIAGSKNSITDFVGNIIMLRIAAAATTAIIAAICIRHFVQDAELAWLLLAGLLISLCYSLNLIAGSIFRAYEKMQYQALTELVGSAVVVFLAILALFYNRGLLWVMVAHVIGA
ncbi:MAG: oligosaccharide flippase family protein, partial [Candidatus Woesearchaeota archaeon]